MQIEGQLQTETRNVTEEDITAVEEESDQSEASIYRIENINRITDNNSKSKRY